MDLLERVVYIIFAVPVTYYLIIIGKGKGFPYSLVIILSYNCNVNLSKELSKVLVCVFGCYYSIIIMVKAGSHRKKWQTFY